MSLPSIQDLDATLPKELQNLVKYGGPLDTDKAVANTTVEPTENKMATEIEKTLTSEQIKAIASKEVETLLATKDTQVALASKIETYVSEVNVAKQEVAAAKASITKVEAELATAKEELATAKKDKAAADSDKKKADDDKDNIIKKYNDAKASLDEKTKVLADITAEKVVASRKDTLEKKKLMSKARADKACARDDKGEFVMSEAAFNEYVADIEEAVAASKSTGPVDTGGKTAKGDTQVDNKEAPHGKAPKAKAGVDDEQDNDGGEVAGAKASTDAMPAAPNLSEAATMAQATAAIMNGTSVPQNQSRVNLFANAFGAR